MSNRDAVLERIRKMLALANDGAASVGEIENAVKMARELMTKYGVEEGDLNTHDPSSKISEEIAAKRCGWSGWEQRLVSAVEQICDVRGFFRKYSRHRTDICFLGFPADVAVACELFPALLVSIKACARMTITEGTGWHFRHRSFAEGFVKGLFEQATRMKRQAVQTHAIILRKDLAIDKWINENMDLRQKRTGPSGHAHDPDAYEKGRAMGNKVELKRNMNAGNGNSPEALAS